MTKVSRKKNNKEGRIINDFWRAVTFAGNKAEVRNFLKALLTPTEMLMLAKRVDVARLLMGDSSYQFIKREVQVTNSTITHVKNSLINGAYNGYLKPLQRLENADAKIRKQIHNKLERVNFKKATLSEAVWKVAGRGVVRQYKKWKKFESAK